MVRSPAKRSVERRRQLLSFPSQVTALPFNTSVTLMTQRSVVVMNVEGRAKAHHRSEVAAFGDVQLSPPCPIRRASPRTSSIAPAPTGGGGTSAAVASLLVFASEPASSEEPSKYAPRWLGPQAPVRLVTKTH